MAKRWDKQDDAKLSSLFETPRNSVNPKDLSVAAVKAVHKKYFPKKDYRNFAPLYRAKARDFEFGRTLEGHRQRSRAAKAAAFESADSDEDSEDNEDYKNEGEEDIDLKVEDTDEEGNKEEEEKEEVVEDKPILTGCTPPRKAAQKAAETIDNITKGISSMS